MADLVLDDRARSGWTALFIEVGLLGDEPLFSALGHSLDTLCHTFIVSILAVHVVE